MSNTRKLDKGAAEISAISTAAITGNPTAGLYGGGLLVEFDTDNANIIVCGAGHEPLGIVEYNAAAGDEVSVKLKDGVVRLVKAGGTITLTDGYAWVEAGAGGTVVQATFAKPIAGKVFKAASTNDFIPIVFGDKPTFAGAAAASYGAPVASAAAIAPSGTVFHVTGTTNITSITTTGLTAGTVFVLVFDGILTFTDGNNLKLAGNMTTSADDTITLAFDGTNFYEVARSAN